jgi:hypothetical protein
MNFEEIKELAKSSNLRVTDLIALAPANDPFYVGRPSEMEAAQWFSDLWQRFGYVRGVHLRRVHYQIVSQNPPVKRPDGKTYENTENCWDYLNNASKWARYLGLVPAAHFVDRRNPEAVINARWPKTGDFDYQDPTPGYEIEDVAVWSDYQTPTLPELPDIPTALPDLPGFDVQGYTGAQQAFHVEIWVEKTTMNDVLIPLCRRYCCNLVTGAGELSITAVIEFLKRVRDADRPARILYVSDYDPAGMGMPISIARKIEFYQRSDGYGDLDIRLHPIALTTDQVAQYDLPRVPVKDSDLRKAGWEASHGEGQVELDALEALHPGELLRIVQRAMLGYFDPRLNVRALSARQELIRLLDDETDTIKLRWGDEHDALRTEYAELWEDFSHTRAAFAELAVQFQPQIDAYQERLADIVERASNLYEAVKEDLDDVEVDMPDVPAPELPEESMALLYDSARDYVDQLIYYKSYRSNTD